ncbi:MAG: capsule assembly Wzi family protein [Nitrospirota bacterium]
MWRFRHFLLVISFLIISPDTASPVNVDINDDVYDLLQKLEAKGLIQSSLLTVKPLNRQEVIRLILEAESNADEKSPFIRNLVQTLKDRFSHGIDNEQFIKPLEDPYMQLTYSDSDNSGRLTYNNDGYEYEKDLNARFGVSSTAEFEQLSFHIGPEIRFSKNSAALLAKKAYGSLHFSGFELEFGKDSQWWGPGHHGSILLSNNTEPLTILKLTNPQPFLLPSVFKHLGLFKFVFFATRLEKDRTVANPFLWGLRAIFKPIPYFELGFSRTALLGGEGRSDGFKTWVKSFLGKDENVTGGGGTGDQRAGIDLKLTLPFKLQPVQIYGEMAGEDEAGGFPAKKAYLGGIYLPGILNMDEFDFRFEYTTTHVARTANVWYNHGIYTSGYTYRGRIIGHHTGTDSEDIFLKLQYFLPKTDNGRISFSYNREKHNLSGKTNETSDEFTLKTDLPFTKKMNIKTVFTFGTIKNLNNVKGVDIDVSVLMSHLTYKF